MHEDLQRDEQQTDDAGRAESPSPGRAPDLAADHGHPGVEEQEARISGAHGWGYGGRPEGASLTAPADDSARDGDPPEDRGDDHPDSKR